MSFSIFSETQSLIPSWVPCQNPNLTVSRIILICSLCHLTILPDIIEEGRKAVTDVLGVPWIAVTSTDACVSASEMLISQAWDASRASRLLNVPRWANGTVIPQIRHLEVVPNFSLSVSYFLSIDAPPRVLCIFVSLPFPPSMDTGQSGSS